MHKAHQQWLEAASSQGGHQSQCEKARMIIMKILREALFHLRKQINC